MKATLSIALLLAAAAFAKDKDKDKKDDAKSLPPIRVCVAQLRNTSRRPVTLVLPQNRLVRELAESKPPKKSPDRRRIEAIALQGDAPENVGNEVTEKQCDYIVYATVVELREKTDPVWQDERAQGIAIGTQAPISGTREPETFAEVQFSLRRQGSPTALGSSSVSGREAANEEITVERLMVQVAQRVNSAVREASEPMRE